MINITIGTAGHIDHGKTTLIKSLTGKDTDNLEEEKRRGITINLGFTHMDFEDLKVGFVDVPGHEKFIKNMVAGVKGIDAVMFIVAADEGIMPQSIEHFNILELMGIEKGFIVITKIDLVDKEFVELVVEEVKELIKGTFLENSDIIRVSSKTRQGIPGLINKIQQLTLLKTKDANIENPRMAIDRVFSLKGIGTVVTGTLSEGILDKNDEVYIYPNKLKSTIRNIQVFNKNVDKAKAGERTAINLRDLDKKDIIRGDELALKDTLKPTNFIECQIKILKNTNREIKNNSRLHLHIGTKEVLARINLSKKESLIFGEESYIKLTTEEKITAKRGDRFILRFYSPLETIGGGIVLDPFPKKSLNADNQPIPYNKGKNTKKYIEYILANNIEFISIDRFIQSTPYKFEYLTKLLNELEKAGTIYNYIKDNKYYSLHKNSQSVLENKILNYLESNEKNNNISLGISKEEIKNYIFNDIDKNIFNDFIEKLKDKKLIKDNKNKITTFEFNPKMTDKQIQLKNNFLEEFEKRDKMLLDIKDFKKDKTIEIIINYMIENNELVEIQKDEVIIKNQLEIVIEMVKGYFIENSKITVVEFRDLIKSNRKHSLMLLEYFDSINLTKRIDDYRIFLQ